MKYFVVWFDFLLRAECQSPHAQNPHAGHPVVDGERCASFLCVSVENDVKNDPPSKSEGGGAQNQSDYLEGFGVSGEGFAKCRYVGFVDYGCAGVDESGHRRDGGGAPVFEFVDSVVVEVVEEF